MNAKGLDQMSNDELRSLLKTSRLDLMSKSGLVAAGKTEFGSAKRNLKRTIARCMTILVKRGERCVA
jgi:ribosomal protein L29